ncbi:hypothetical protein SAMD00019534_090700 [Acytostelium subglobosum LB1]|uniref:hypothetical protein n=1 Tax=Acytostelium subglobosum LB1 TaxID=1410327 RepID=UPI00064483B5|nr:hypothetical protein SAMD00019534_090700 [Acytostelium subglobosum LB1]GAM25895.1 hypothetical protein SAMD00019534_090700 [Acytostelium subglobosum LB1]|eukprot:XP_012750938.1 hypothetical protein SAMD00019534_090700 [Acytostelium subglobosum LB1]
MTKTRFSSIDIRTTVCNLQRSVIGLRLANIYDLSPRVFLLKLSKPDNKKTLIIESGIRIHSTNFTRDKGDHTPAPFSITLRKYLKTKRLESVKQLGVDRIVDFTFGSGVATQHLIIELFSIGNIILTDGDYKVLAILRTHQFKESDNIAVGDVYPVDNCKQPSTFTTELIEQILTQQEDKKETLKQVFNKSLDFGPELIEHCLLSAGLQSNLRIEQYEPEKYNQALIESFKEGQKIYDVAGPSKGYIVLKPPKENKPQQQAKKQKEAAALPTSDEPPKELVVYEEFVPFLYKQYQTKKYLEYDSFDLAVDQFFSEIESQKVEQQRIAQEQTVLKKLDKVRDDQQRRIDSLYAAEADNQRKAQLIEANLQEVDQCILIIRSGVAASMDWTTLAQMLKEEKKKNPYSVANKIHKLKLETNQISLALTDAFLYDDNQDGDESDDSDEDDNSDNDGDDSKQKERNKKHNDKEARKPTLIDVDLSLTAFANAREYYDSKKHSHEKAQKTIQQADFALKAAEKKSRQQLGEVKAKASMIQMRKVFWFEKFHWFISSDNYLVISGKDAQQNELLFKKYMEKDDIYVHADIFGSTSCLIKNQKGGPIPPNTLIQAGTMTMCYSNAWSAKVVTSAYWVYANQVSKTAPSGEFLTTGSFMIRGKKNYLPHSQLVMGFGFMFKIDDSCIANHVGERSPSYGQGDADDDDDISNEPAGEDGTGEKKLRKFERAKLKKEQEEEAFAEMDGMEVSDQITSTTVSTKAQPVASLGQSTDSSNKYRIKLVSSFHEDEEKTEQAKETQQQSGIEETITQSKGDNQKNKSHMTAFERRQQKKGGPGDNEEDTETPVAQQQQQQKQQQQQTSAAKEKKGEPTKHLLPSQKNKLKKIKEKYGDQDEEERQERMKLLGSAGSKKEDKKKDKKGQKGKQQQTPAKKTDNSKQESKPKATGEKESAQKVETTTDTKDIQTKLQDLVFKQEDTMTATPTTSTTSTTTTQPLSTEEQTSDNEEDEDDNNNNNNNGEEKSRKGRKEKREDKMKEQEEIKQLLEEENMAAASIDSENVTNIDTLTGQPLENDILHFAIPVVGPYTIFTNYKYKVKLTPGQLKRGKAAKQASAALLQNPNMSKREKELIKNIKDEELTANMLADVRLHAPNLLASKKKEKQLKKEKAIEKANEEAQLKEEKKQPQPTQVGQQSQKSSTAAKK